MFSMRPRDLYGVAYRALDLARAGGKALGYAGIELLCDAVYEIRLIEYHADRFSKVMVALYMGGYADNEEYGGYLFIEGLGLGA